MIGPANPPVSSQRLRVLWPLFFFQFAAIGIYFPYLNVYFASIGLTGTQMGMISMVGSLVSFGSAILWGIWADRSGKAGWLIAFSIAMTLSIVQLIPLTQEFVVFLGLTFIISLFAAAPGTLVDSTSLALLGEQRNDYGRYRFAGTIGYILATPIAGYLYDRIGLRWMFPIYGLVLAGFLVTALFLPKFPVRIEQKGRLEIGKLIRQRSWQLFTLVIFLCWIANNASILFMGVALQSMGASQSLIGLAITIGAVVEMPFMFFSGSLLRKTGPVTLLMVAISLMVLRFFLLSWMPGPEWAIAINMLNGPAFVFFWNSSITYANSMAPPGLGGTAQGLITATSSLSGVVSSILTGWLLDRSGAQSLFLVMAYVSLAALVLFSAPRLAGLLQNRGKPA